MRCTRAGTSSGRPWRAPSSPGSRSRWRWPRGATRWPTGARARGTTRCASSWPTRRWPPTSRSSPPGGSGSSRPARTSWSTPAPTACPSPSRARSPTAWTRTSGTSASRAVSWDPWAEPPREMFRLTVDPEEAPSTPEYVEITFERGTPVAVDGQRRDPVSLVAELNRRAGAHGVGRVDIVENRLVGMKSRGVYETPGGTVLAEAHHHLQTITLDRDTHHYKALVAPKYAELVYNGLWYSPLRRALDAFVAATQETVTGTVRVRLFKGACTVVGRRADRSLYSHALATFGRGEGYDHKDAAGFIRLFGLPAKVFARVNPEITGRVGLVAAEAPGRGDAGPARG